MAKIIEFPGGAGRLLRKREVAELVGVSERTVERWSRERGLPRRRVGPNTVRFPEREVLAWIRDRA